jgi:hypothetical protein
VLKGEARFADDSERLGLAEVCQIKRLNAGASRFFAEALANNPKLADDLQAGHRYNAACAAALAATGQGADAASLDAQGRARWRRQALDWLRAHLAAWAKGNDRGLVQRTLKHWQKDSDLAGVRDQAALANLPEAERQAWQKLWADVGDILKKSMKYPSIDESFDRLHQAGWSIGDAAFGAKLTVWQVSGTNGENVLVAYGFSRGEANSRLPVRPEPGKAGQPEEARPMLTVPPPTACGSPAVGAR